MAGVTCWLSTTCGLRAEVTREWFTKETESINEPVFTIGWPIDVIMGDTGRAIFDIGTVTGDTGLGTT